MQWSKVYDLIGLFHRYAYILFLLGLAFFLPVNNRMSSIFLGLMVINWVVEFRFIAKVKRIILSRHRFHLLLFITFYLLYLIGLLYSSNMNYGRFDIEVKLSLAVIPLMFSTMDVRVFQQAKPLILLRLYVYGCLFGVLFCLVRAFIRYGESGDPGVFYYMQFSYLHHTGYFAMFLNFALILLMLYVWNKHAVIPKWEQWLIPVLMVLFTITIVLLASKMGMITLVMIFTVCILLMLFHRAPAGMIGRPAMLLVLLLLLVFASPFTMERLTYSTKVVQSMDSLETTKNESTTDRLLVWRSSWNIIKAHPWFGVGTGDVKDALLEDYEKHGITSAFNLNMDAHNQYLQTMIALGIPGILTLVLMLLLPAIAALRRQDYLYLLFLILFSMNLLIESMFENQAGVVFYAFLNGLLFWNLPAFKPNFSYRKQ